MSIAVAAPHAAATFVCPQCGAVAAIETREGREVVAVYCLHRQGLSGAQPVRMEPVEQAVETAGTR